MRGRYLRQLAGIFNKDNWLNLDAITKIDLSSTEHKSVSYKTWNHTAGIKSYESNISSRENIWTSAITKHVCITMVYGPPPLRIWGIYMPKLIIYKKV